MTPKAASANNVAEQLETVNDARDKVAEDVSILSVRHMECSVD